MTAIDRRVPKNRPRMLTPEEKESLRQDLKDTIRFLRELRESDRRLIDREVSK